MGQGCGVNFLTLSCLATGLGKMMAYNEKLSDIIAFWKLDVHYTKKAITTSALYNCLYLVKGNNSSDDKLILTKLIMGY